MTHDIGYKGELHVLWLTQESLHECVKKGGENKEQDEDDTSAGTTEQLAPMAL